MYVRRFLLRLCGGNEHTADDLTQETFFQAYRSDNSYQLYMNCSYEESSFIAEKERLEAIELAYKDEVHKPIITDRGFNYRAVVTVFGDQGSYEYALIDEETRTIVYVFAQSMGIDESVVPSEYRPQGFEPSQEVLNKMGRYNFYYFKADNDFPGEVYVIPGKDV